MSNCMGELNKFNPQDYLSEDDERIDALKDTIAKEKKKKQKKKRIE